MKMRVKTNRLLIREMLPEDWMRLKRIAEDFAHSEYAIYDAALPTQDQEIMELTRQFAESHLFFSVFLQESWDMIGYICFHNRDGNYDLGYCFHSAYHGNGYALESCLEMMRYMEQSHKVKSFTAGTALDNIPSCKLLKKLGFVLAGTESLSFCKDERDNDIVFEGGNFVFIMQHE